VGEEVDHTKVHFIVMSKLTKAGGGGGAGLTQMTNEEILSSLKDLEMKMTEYHRQDTIPAWAQELFPRLDNLELFLQQQNQKSSVTSSLITSTSTNSTASSPSSHLSMKEMLQQDDLIHLIQQEVNHKTLSLKLSFDSKLSAASLEIDRLHKLLSIRPTTSEFQTVFVQIQQLKQQTEVQTGILSSEINYKINEKLVEEMGSIAEKFKKNDLLTEQSTALLMQRVDDLEGELRSVRQHLKSELESSENILEENMSHSNELREKLSELQEQFHRSSMTMRSAHDTLCDTVTHTERQLNDVVKSMNQRVESLENDLSEEIHRVHEELSGVDERVEEIREMSRQGEEVMEEMRRSQSEEMETIMKTLVELHDQMSESSTQQASLLKSVQRFEDSDLINKLSTTMDTLSSLTFLSETHSHQLLSHQTTSDQVLLTIQDIRDTLENIPNLINIESLKIDGNIREIRSMKDLIRQLRNTSSDHEGQILELLKLPEQMMILRDLYELQEERIKKILKTLTEIFETTEMTERRFDELNQIIQMTEEKLYHRISYNHRLVEERVMNSVIENEQKFLRLQDQLMKAMSEGGGGGRGGGGNGGKKFPFAKLKSFTLLKKGGGASGVGGGGGGEGEGGDDFDDQDDPNASEREEQLDLAIQLCLSFEDVTGYRNISPKDLPSRMCGEMAMTAQELATLISSSVDIETIKRSIYRQGGGGGEGGGTSEGSGGESVNELRIKLMNQTIQGMKKKLHESSPSPGALQQEARNMFISRMQQALQLAMSKHDQVVAVNATCLGRIKLPTCIACDRPMGTKVPTPSSRHFHT
jgi:hypothetical protein